MKGPVAVTHVGAITPMGLGALETGFVYRAQGIGFRSSALVHPESGEPLLAGTVPVLEPLLVGAARVVELGKRALDDLFQDGGSVLGGLRLRVWLCIDEWLAERDAEGVVPSVELLRLLRVHARSRFGEGVEVRVCAMGAASPGRILEDALAELDAGDVDAVVLGGAHSDQCPVRVRALWSASRLYSSENLDGVLPGEGAAFVSFMQPAAARRLGARSAAHLVALGTGHDKARPDNDESAFAAAGLTLAVRSATEALSAQGLRVGWQLNDLGFESFRTSEWMSVMTRTQAIWQEPQVSDSPCQRLGHLGAATLPVQLALAVEAWRRGYAPHRRLLCLAGSDDGFRVSALVEGNQDGS